MRAYIKKLKNGKYKIFLYILIFTYINVYPRINNYNGHQTAN